MERWQLVLAALAAGACGARAHYVERPSCPSDAQQRCTYIDTRDFNQYNYIVDGKTLHIKFILTSDIVLECPGNLTIPLDNTALPRFKSELRVSTVKLKGCQPPRGSYAAALAALNVTVTDRLKLVRTGNVTRAHLAGLERLLALKLKELRLAAGALGGLPGLYSLQLKHVRLPRDALRHLPCGLQALTMNGMGAALPTAANPTVRDGAGVTAALPPTLRNLTMQGWKERRLVPWTSCGLFMLVAQSATAEELPAGWLADCSQLRELRVEFAANLATLHATSLHGARHLRELSLRSCALTALPARLLDDAVELSQLNLSKNLLIQLPSGLFARTWSLQWLDLSGNRLSTGVFASLSAVTSLSELRLGDNPLRDSCSGASDTARGMSPLKNLKKLTKLYLYKTNTSLICRDWRENMPLLQAIDLAGNNFNSITYADLQFRGAVNVMVDLSDNNVTALLYTEHDYWLVTNGSDASRATVELDATLACDCRAYWAARALRDRPAHLRLSRAPACASGLKLSAAPLDALVCAAPELCAGAPPACACTRRAGAARPERLLRLTCERAGLASVVQATGPVSAALHRAGAAPDDYDWQLRLPHNHITDLRATDLPRHLSVLDLRHNKLGVLDADAAQALVADERRRVWLADNPLACDCAAAAAVAALQARSATLTDYDDVVCADLTPLRAVNVTLCSAPGGPGAGVTAAATALLTLLAAALLAGLLWHPAVRLRIKVALYRRGWLPTPAEPDDDGRRFDAFVSFSHGDERFVRSELVARLESGPAPYRLCVHYRDWAPGGWIPTQIAASVRESRRTVAVVSEHFLRSAWARAELQEAYALALRDARPRLVVVLLAAPERLPLDATLRQYLANNTYLRWGDPWFWQKLYLALPRGRGRAEPGAPTSPDELDAPLAAPPATPPAPQAAAACSVPSSLSSSSSSSSSSSAPWSSSGACALELGALRPSCGAQYVRDIAAFAAPLRSKV